MRLAAFATAFLLPFAVAALPLLSIAFSDSGTSAGTEQLAVTDVPAGTLIEEQTQPAMAYGTSNPASSTVCDGTSIVAIEG